MTPATVGEGLLFLALAAEAYAWRRCFTTRRAEGLLLLASWVAAWHCLGLAGSAYPEWGWAGVAILLAGLVARLWQVTGVRSTAELATVSMTIWLGAALLTQRLVVGAMLMGVVALAQWMVLLTLERPK
ncbi:MAG: hypothetical protein K2X03_18320 [Bryobacteraceae bacterium]|nr:hypothetical protein [Bryobacteraceae bacterium]